MAPMIEARTISSRPDLSATVAMISSGRLPKVALRRPPTAEPVRAAMCSVPCTIRRAAGTIARAAAKNTRAGEASGVLQEDAHRHEEEQPVRGWPEPHDRSLSLPLGQARLLGGHTVTPPAAITLCTKA